MNLSPRVLAFVLCAAFAASSPIPAECADKETGEQKAPALETSQDKNADQNKQDAADSACWDTVRDGEPAVELPKLIKEAAKRTDAKYQTIGSVRTMRIDEEYSSADLDFMFLDEYGRILRFIEEVDKTSPHLFWRRIDFRIDPASVKDGAPKIRMAGMIRVITYTPEAGAASAEEKPKKKALTPGNPDIISLLYSLSLALHDDAIMTSFRLNEKTCDFSIQGSNAFVSRFMENNVPGWAIRRVQQRQITDSLFTFSVSLEKEENPKPRQGVIPQENMVKTIEALNIFDPERASKKAADKPEKQADPGEEMILMGTTFVGDRSAAIILLRDPDGRIAATLEKRLAEAAERKRKAIEDRDELATVYRTLRQSPNTKEQADMVRQRLERYDKEIERIREQERELALQGSYAGKTAATIDNSGKRIVNVGDTLPNGFTLKAVTRTTATFTRDGETVELTLKGTDEKKP